MQISGMSTQFSDQPIRKTGYFMSDIPTYSLIKTEGDDLIITIIFDILCSLGINNVTIEKKRQLEFNYWTGLFAFLIL